MAKENKGKAKKYQKSSNIQNRDIRVTIRLTKAEYSEIERTFKQEKFNRISDYIRYKLLIGGQFSTTKTKQEFYEKLIFEINKIGVNVNQVTKVINQNRGYAGDRNVRVLEGQLDSLLERLDIILQS
ncbi:plasmid mobilization protein [Parapedobacter sp. 10938]|uniref:plasmid mobilization protein n=1 Tax=Parapedobacter flavus TaxID=3110225 RepID=UPI002DB8A16A|nr:plasmid mobilization relaxosome protein MobC [Parapedobacter sp. 10938]MEC3881824.1 plasmid mobilization relaxosome protein MobC [Parapedobacter sp. 10938]